jgi:NAD(P)-dependent dehydrogenase (short-subunit alcohol dehydrogenase family)
MAGVNSVSLGREISDLTLPARLIGEVVNHFGRLDVLVNNFKGVILLPCSNLAGYITGQQIFIDGGLTGTGPG